MKNNRNQEAAIFYGEGPLMIVAGPGSGKTYTITERVAWLITSGKARPYNILVVTFSRAAAAEMRERFLNMNIPHSNQVTFGTFHSVFYRVLKTAYGSLARNYIFDDEEQDKIRYDEMLYLTKELLETREDICDALRKKYQWILIDEFQDIDEVQFDIIRQLAPPRKWYSRKKTPNITVVGDDDQAIYSFRGANPGYMLRFGRVYPGTRRIILDVNYRSTKEIVKAASEVVKKNRHRYVKHLKANNPRGEKIKIIGFDDVRAQYRYVARNIKAALTGGTDPSEIAVLYRNNVQQWQLDKVFSEYGIEDVNAMTFHRSKGLEFDDVWIIDANEGITPSYKAKTQAELEEERRAFYVAMTRAKKRLYITYSRTMREREAKPSEYLNFAISSRSRL